MISSIQTLRSHKNNNEDIFSIQIQSFTLENIEAMEAYKNELLRICGNPERYDIWKKLIANNSNEIIAKNEISSLSSSPLKKVFL